MTEFDLKTLNLADGTHEITVVAKASGYKDSTPSNEISYVVASGEETKTISTGTYVFNKSIPTSGKANLSANIQYISNSITYNSIRLVDTFSFGIENLQVDMYYDNTNVYNGGGEVFLEENYRTIQVLENATVSKEFYEWFVANAVKQEQTTYTISAGTYVFNEELDFTNISADINESFTFTPIDRYKSNLIGITVNPVPIITYYEGVTDSYIVYNTGWLDESYRTINTTTEQTVSKEFYDWFVDNTYTLSGIYLFNTMLTGMTGVNYTKFNVNYTTEYYDGNEFISATGTFFEINNSGLILDTSNFDADYEWSNRYSDGKFYDGANMYHKGWYSFSEEHGSMYTTAEMGGSERIRTYDFGSTPQPVPEDFYNWVQTNAVKKSLITFTIDGTTYQAENGMTWEEWCESEYNTYGYSMHDNGCGVELGRQYIVEHSDGTYIGYDEEIIKGHQYIHGAWYSGSGGVN